MTKPKAVTDNNGCVLSAVAIGAIVLLISIGRCSAPSTSQTEPFTSPTLENQIANIETEKKIDPLDTAAVARGAKHMRLVFDAEGLSGAMIYSQNCYDRLSHDFSWSTLDDCGGFDMVAVKAADDADTSALQNEAAYFESEAAAARYLTAATKAGEPAEEADTRLEALQKRLAATKPIAKPTPSPSATQENPTEVQPEAGDDSGTDDAPQPEDAEVDVG